MREGNATSDLVNMKTGAPKPDERSRLRQTWLSEYLPELPCTVLDPVMVATSAPSRSSSPRTSPRPPSSSSANVRPPSTRGPTRRGPCATSACATPSSRAGTSRRRPPTCSSTSRGRTSFRAGIRKGPSCHSGLRCLFPRKPPLLSWMASASALLERTSSRRNR